MSTYMLNLIFDPTDSSSVTDSRFQEDPGPSQQNPLLRSKVWLLQSNNNSWTVFGTDSGAPLVLKPGQDQVMVRVAGANVTSSWVARLTVVISRDTGRALTGPQGHYQKRASPFPAGQTTQSCVIYDFEDPTYQPMANGAWIQPLGSVTLYTSNFPGGKPASYHDAYTAVVAITAGVGSVPGQGQDNDPSNVVIFSHDPDMNVDC